MYNMETMLYIVYNIYFRFWREEKNKEVIWKGGIGLKEAYLELGLTLPATRFIIGIYRRKLQFHHYRNIKTSTRFFGDLDILHRRPKMLDRRPIGDLLACGDPSDTFI